VVLRFFTLHEDDVASDLPLRAEELGVGAVAGLPT
jgi:hypothetical protein